ncbi:MAG: hypothetical protein HYW15_00715 [Candidatus Giovannonibacteria bacterium]|nr:MAG: hypothetical protein HYW15_00715 [Candidatus Giovannonibacteria bacterium]
MSKERILAVLLDSGFQEKEAHLYLAGIELGEATIQQLAKHADIKRPTAYDIMENLEKKGLFSFSERGKKKYFLAEDPENILRILKSRERAFLTALPELKMLLGAGSKKPRVRFFEGVGGLKAMYWDTLESKKTLLVYGAIDSMWSAIPQEFKKEYVRERVKRNLSARCIVPATPEAQEYTKRDKEELRHMILIPSDRFPFSNEINIYNNKVAIFSFPERIGVIIESEKIAETQRSIFELAWLGAIKGV